MEFCLVPQRGEDLFINAWNWRPTVELLWAHALISDAQRELMNDNAGAEIDRDHALCIAEFLITFLESLGPGDRVMYDLTITSQPDTFEIYRYEPEKNYAATAAWLATFRDFCIKSG